MLKASVGDEVSIHYDSDDPVEIGDLIQTRTGRTYKVTALRIQKSGIHKGRYHLRCLVIETPEIGTLVHQLFWYPRK